MVVGLEPLLLQEKQYIHESLLSERIQFNHENNAYN